MERLGIKNFDDVARGLSIEYLGAISAILYDFAHIELLAVCDYYNSNYYIIINSATVRNFTLCILEM